MTGPRLCFGWRNVSFDAWKSAGYPGAVSFDRAGNRKDRQPDRLRGACRLEGCELVATRGTLCYHHWRAIA